MADYTSEQFWKLYQKLPQELKDILFAEDTGDQILDACSKYGADDESTKISKLVGKVLVGLLPPDDFQNALESEIGLTKETARQINHDLTRFIFYPVKETLYTLYNLKPTEPSGKESISGVDLKTTPASPRVPETGSSLENYPKGGGSDTYREPVE